MAKNTNTQNTHTQDDRKTVRQKFLDRAGWGQAEHHPLPGDASFRRYIRLVQNNKVTMLMDAPPPTEDVKPFAKMARHLLSKRFSAPIIIAEDTVHGFLLLEDFGNDTFTHLLNQGTDEDTLYTLATNTLIALHAIPAPKWLAPYDTEILLTETNLFLDWYATAHTINISTATRCAYDQIWQDLFVHLYTGPKTLVLRDYHVDNLMWLKNRGHHQACGLLDFQDALLGHPAYDLMSLLEDARRDVSPALQAHLKTLYHKARNTKDRAAFDTSYAILAAQRHTKVIGIFTRLDRRDGKPQYLKHMDRLWRLLDQSLAHPKLERLKKWMDTHIPQNERYGTRTKP